MLSRAVKAAHYLGYSDSGNFQESDWRIALSARGFETCLHRDNPCEGVVVGDLVDVSGVDSIGVSLWQMRETHIFDPTSHSFDNDHPHY